MFLGPRYPDSPLGRLRQLGSPFGATENGPMDRFVAPIRRPLDRALAIHFGRVRELGKLAASVSRTSRPSNGKRVLVLTLRMWMNHAATESIIAQALRLRGAEVALLTCGGGQPICEMGWGRRVAPRPCDRCAHFTDRVARTGRFPLLRLADEFPWGSSPDRAPAKLDGPAAVDHSDAARASVTWFVKSADTERVPRGAAVAVDFGVSVSAVEAAAGRIIDRFRPDVVFAVNGLFAAERAVRAAAAERGVRVVTYEYAPRKGTLVYGESSPAPEMITDALAEDQRVRPLSDQEAEALDTLLRSRMTGASSHETYFDATLEHDVDTVRATLGIDRDRRVVSVFTNLAYDTALLGKDVAFDSQFDWLARTVELVAAQDDVALVIRVHPAESRWGTAQPVKDELIARVGELPPNVRLVGPNEPVSSYGILAFSDLVLCYTTTVGLEAAARGIPVAVAGATHYRGRGFTIDVESYADLEKAIAEPPPMTPEQVELARRYAFAFFFRLMIPFRYARYSEGHLAGIPVSAHDLLPGRDPHLDFVCDRIVYGGDLFLPPELALAAPA